MPTGNEKDVVELTDSNFEELIGNSDDMWLVEFFAPWCGHCKNLAPHWASAATELKGKVKVRGIFRVSI
jgi:protein disulfide-isomerase A6